MKIEITEVTVLTGHGADHIMCQTDLPEATWPYEGKMCMDFTAAAGRGVEYVRKHFGVEPKIINIGHK